MEFELGIEIAGIQTCLSIEGGSSYLLAHLHRDYAAFSIQPCEKTPRLEMRIENGEPFISRSSGIWQIDTRQEAEIIQFISHKENGWYDLAARRGELLMRPGGHPENFLRVLYAWRGLEAGALLLHASGVIRLGRGYAFFGASGSGKTTVTRLLDEGLILSDDLVILRCKEGEPSVVQIYGTPFRGELVEAPRLNESACLAGLYSLVKDSSNHLQPVRVFEAVSRLAACAPFVMFRPDSAARVLALCERINQLTPVQALHFRPEAEIWSVIDG